MTDPFTTAVAAALATKAVNGLTDAGRSAFAALLRLVRRRLAAGTQTGVLQEAERHPTSDIHRQALAEALAQTMVDDPAFSDQLGNLWRRVLAGRTDSSRSPVSNVVYGDIGGSLLQARDIHGNVSFK